MSEKIPVALVTGVGPGAGAAISRRFALGGYRVAILARTSERLEALQRELPHAKRYPCDVTDETQLDSVIEAVRRDLCAPKVLVHNAVGGSLGNFMEIDPKVLNSNFQVNTMALLYQARRLAPAMVEAGEGAIVVPAIPQPCGENLASRDSLPPRRRNGSLSEEIYHRTRDAFAVYMAGINSALSAGRGFIVGDRLTLADVCFVAELALFHNEKPRARDLKKRGLEPILSDNLEERFADAMGHFARLAKHPAFAPDVIPYLEKIEHALTDGLRSVYR